MRKKLLSVLLVITILLSSIEFSVKEAQAAWMIPFIPAIAEGLVSLSEILLLTVATYATGCAVSESFDQSDVDYIAAKLDTATDAAGDWWRDIKGSAVRVDDPTVSLQDDIAMGKVINFSDYYQPDGGKPSNNNEPRKSKKIDVTAPVALGIAKVIKDFNKTDDITKIGQQKIVEAIIKEYSPNAVINQDFNVPYVIVTKNDDNITVGCSLLNPFVITFNSSTGLYNANIGCKVGYGEYFSYYVYYFNGSVSLYNNLGSIKTMLLTQRNDRDRNAVTDKILYYNQPSISDEVNYYPPFTGAYIPTTLPPSIYSSANTKNGFTIIPTKELRDTISNAQPVKTTDDITKLVLDADKLARAKGGQVINVDIDGNTSVQPEEPNNQSIIDTIKNWVGNPLQGIWDFLKDILNKILSAIKEIPDLFRGFIEWIKDAWNDISDLPGQIGQSIKAVAIELFVPTSIDLDNFKNQAENIIETKTGILSYPLVLLIKLGDFILNMDERDCILTIPKIQFNGYVLCEKTDFNFTEFVNRDEYKKIYGYYRIVSDIFLIMCVLWLAGRKIDKIMEGKQS